jgi:hypothetical protein
VAGHYYDSAIAIIKALRDEGLSTEADAIDEAVSTATLGTELVSILVYELKRTNVAEKSGNLILRKRINGLLAAIERELSTP